MWMEGKYHAFAGDHEMAIDRLDRAFGSLQGLSSEWQDELVRDISLDPVFAGLRHNFTLHSRLIKHLGADAPLVSR